MVTNATYGTYKPIHVSKPIKKPFNQYDEVFNSWNIGVKMIKIVEI